MPEIQTITDLRSLRDSVREQISEVDFSVYSDQRFGSEQEYDYKSLLGGVEGLLADLSVLTKHPNQFLKISTYQERINIKQQLNSLNVNFNNPAHILQCVENLKTHLRPYCARTRKEWFESIGNEADEIIKKKLTLQSSIQDAENTKKQILELKSDANSKYEEILKERSEQSETLSHKESEIDEQIETAENKNTSLEERAKELEDLISQLEESKEESETLLSSIKEDSVSSASNEKLIENFSKRITDRDNKLDEIAKKTDTYQQSLEQFEKEREDLLGEAHDLIESAKLALKYKTAEGLSAAFQTEVDNVKQGGLIGWLIGAVGGLAIALYLGWTVIVMGDGDIEKIIFARIALIPLPLAMAWFCASQFTKRSNIITDYGYKITLAKSLVGFSEQLLQHGSDEKEEYIHYIKNVLSEMLQDPLRQRPKKNHKEDKSSELSDAINLAEKVININKP